jgi:hypothetical protein
MMALAVCFPKTAISFPSLTFSMAARDHWMKAVFLEACQVNMTEYLKSFQDKVAIPSHLFLVCIKLICSMQFRVEGVVERP